MERTLCHSLRFTDAGELVEAIATLVEHSSRKADEVYVSGDFGGFFRGGTASLYEETLTDGSTVFDIELGE